MLEREQAQPTKMSGLLSEDSNKTQEQAWYSISLLLRNWGRCGYSHDLIADAYNKSFRFSTDNSESPMHLLRVSQLI